MKKLFYIYDSVEEVNVGYFECQSLDILLRNNGKIFAQMSPHYVEDWSFFCLGNAPRPHKEGLLFAIFPCKFSISILASSSFFKPVSLYSFGDS